MTHEITLTSGRSFQAAGETSLLAEAETDGVVLPYSCRSGCDVLMHLASHTPNPPYAELGECLYWNVTAAMALAEQALEVGIEDYVVAGSCFEYGHAAYHTDLLAPDTPLEPSLSYPTSKAAASIAFTGWAREKGLRLKVIRIFQTYDPGEGEKRLWPALCRAAEAGEDFRMTAGDQLRDFIRVEDVARCFVASLPLDAIEKGVPLITHAATGKLQTLLEFSTAIWRDQGATGKLDAGALPYRHNEMMRVISHPDAVDPAMRKLPSQPDI
jgi:nucleoside-diphosphate-sugar epimerase